MERVGGRTARLTGTALLATLVIVFDYSLKFSGLKIPFPWLPFLKFDFTGVPIVISLLLYGFTSGTTTSAVAFLGILARSGDLVGALMKGIAEFSTISGMTLGEKLKERWRKAGYMVVGVTLRVIAMSVMNLIVLPLYYRIPFTAAVAMLPMLAVFNTLQGALTVFTGYLLYEAYVRRVSVHYA